MNSWVELILWILYGMLLLWFLYMGSKYEDKYHNSQKKDK
jgi:hypothetical protein